MTPYSLKVLQNQNVEIDLNGCEVTIKTTKEKGIENEGILTISDSSSDKTGKIIFPKITYAIYNNGTIKLNGGEINLAGEGTVYGIYNYGIGQVIQDGGDVTVEINYYNWKQIGYGIYNTDNSTIHLVDGSINVSVIGTYQTRMGQGIRNEGYGDILLDGGTINVKYTNLIKESSSAQTGGVWNTGHGNVTINDC